MPYLFRYRGTAAAGRYGFVSHEPPDYMNILPEDKRLAEVSSNIWGTKFKILGLSLNYLPQNLGQINYKASLFVLLCSARRFLEADQNNNLSREPSQPGQ